MRTLTLLCAALAVSTSTFAQVHKCEGPDGIIYSERPCPRETKGGTLDVGVRPPVAKPEARSTVLNIATRPAPAKLVTDPQLLKSIQRLCESEATKWLRFKDPGSVQFDTTPTASEVVMSSPKASGPALRMFMSINAKNSYGGYVGFKSYTCYTDPQAIKVVGYSEFLLE